MLTNFLLSQPLSWGMAIFAFATTFSVPNDKREADRQAIRAHIESVFQAYMKKDHATLRATHAKDWRGFIRPSRTIIRGIDEYMRAAESILSGPANFTNYRILDFDVVFNGDVATVSYIADLEWQFEGVNYPDKLRVLDVYAKEKGHWNQTASNVTTHPEASEAGRQQPQALTPSQRRQLLADREKVWRAYFTNDQKHLEAVIPPETIAINAGEEQWADRAAILAGAQQFAQSGAKLVRLEFPRTEIQVYGDVAILYTTYLFEIESAGQRQSYAGRGTEIFVRRNGVWVNSGWHLDSGK